MKIIISPAKTMNIDTDSPFDVTLPKFIDKTTNILETLQQKSFEELKSVWKCNDKLATLNYERLQDFDLKNNLTPAILSYEGLQYKNMSPNVFTYEMLDYITDKLRVLSGFYGILKPFDGVSPYRLEMQADIKVSNSSNLYDFWSDYLYNELGDVILNLASKEYSKCIEKYLKPTDKFVTCIFGELKGNKVIQKATFAKMARGEMVRFMAEKQITSLEDVKTFNSLGFSYDETRSTENEFVFIK